MVDIDMDAVYVPSGDIVARVIEGELIIVPLVAGIGDMEDELFSANETGKAIWDRLDGKNNLKLIVKSLEDEFDAPREEIEKDVRGFVGEAAPSKDDNRCQIPNLIMSQHEEKRLSSQAVIDLLNAVLNKEADFRFKASGVSMYPTIRNGDIITISSLKGLKLKPGDIVAFRHPTGEKLAVHRIISIGSDSCLIRGDNSPDPDGLVRESDILGLVTKVERNDHAIFWPDRRKWPNGARMYSVLYFRSIQMRKMIFTGLKSITTVVKR